MDGTLHYQVTGMRCAACAGTLEKRSRKFPGVSGATASFAARKLRLVLKDPGAFDAQAFGANLRTAGFLICPPGSEASREEQESPGWLLPVLGMLGLPVLLVEHGAPLGSLPHFVVPLLATLVQALGGREFYRGALQAWRAGSGTMDTLVACGITVAYGMALTSFLRPSLALGPPRFETAVMLILFLRLGRSLEERMRRRARVGLDRLALESVPEVVLLELDGSERRLPVEALRPGDRVQVLPGEQFPVDGIIHEGTSEVSEAFLTGEPLPVLKRIGSPVYGGSANGTGRLVVTVSEVGGGTLLAQIQALAQDALMEKPPIQRFADRAAGVFVPVVLGLATITLLGWLLVTGDASLAIRAATAVVVIACPCALGLATPTAVMVAAGSATDLGVLFRTGGAIEALAEVDTLVFDKTGTLTTGRFTFRRSIVAAGHETRDVVDLAARIEAASAHPLAAAFRFEPPALPFPTSREHPGQGIEAEDLEGRTLRLGSTQWLLEQGVDQAGLEALQAQSEGSMGVVLALARDAEPLGLFEVDDSTRPEARDALQYFKTQSLDLKMLSGDRPSRVERTATDLGIEGLGGLLPQEKLAKIEQWQGEGRRIGFVGDGINDAPALARADLGIALGHGAALAQQQGGLVLLNDDLRALPRAHALARRTMATIRMNLTFALGYNLLGLPLAAGLAYPWTGALLPPHFAGLAMSLSSLCVVANSLRLGREELPPIGELR